MTVATSLFLDLKVMWALFSVYKALVIIEITYSPFACPHYGKFVAWFGQLNVRGPLPKGYLLFLGAALEIPFPSSPKCLVDCCYLFLGTSVVTLCC